MVAVLKVGLVERIYRTRSEARVDADTTLRDRLRPLVNGVVRTLSVRETLKGWREAALGEMKGVIKQVCAFYGTSVASTLNGCSMFVRSSWKTMSPNLQTHRKSCIDACTTVVHMRDSRWAEDLRAIGHQQFLTLLRMIYRRFLSGLEGVEALNNALLEAINSAK